MTCLCPQCKGLVADDQGPTFQELLEQALAHGELHWTKAENGIYHGRGAGWIVLLTESPLSGEAFFVTRENRVVLATPEAVQALEQAQVATKEMR